MPEGIGRMPSDNVICGKSTISESRESLTFRFILEQQLLSLRSTPCLLNLILRFRLNSYMTDRCSEASQGCCPAVSVVESNVGLLRRQIVLFKQVNRFLSGKRQRFFFDN